MQQRVAAAGKAAWMIATGDDLRLPTTTSTAGAGSGRMMRFQHRYLDRVIAAATRDETVLAAVMDAFFLISPPESLFRPAILRRTLRRRPPAELTHQPCAGDVVEPMKEAPPMSHLSPPTPMDRRLVADDDVRLRLRGRT